MGWFVPFMEKCGFVNLRRTADITHFEKKSIFVLYGGIMIQDSFEFVVYMIHACANKWNRLPSAVYKKLRDSGCIQKFLVPNYEIMHTQGTDFVVSDIEEYLKVRKVAI